MNIAELSPEQIQTIKAVQKAVRFDVSERLNIIIDTAPTSSCIAVGLLQLLLDYGKHIDQQEKFELDDTIETHFGYNDAELNPIIERALHSGKRKLQRMIPDSME